MKFEDILVWQKARIFTVAVYKNFTNCRDFSFRDQIQRAAVSVMNNIAEGHARLTDKDFRHFLYIVLGSAAEIRSMLYLALDLGYIDKFVFDNLSCQVNEISKMLSGFIKAINNQTNS